HMRTETTQKDLPPALAIPQTGVLTLAGYASSVKVMFNHLVVHGGEWDSDTHGSISRIAGLKRLVIIGRTGNISLRAIGGLQDVGAELILLDHADQVMAWSGRFGRSLAHLRRAQALAPWTEAGEHVIRWLLSQKIERQSDVLRAFDNDAAL